MLTNLRTLVTTLLTCTCACALAQEVKFNAAKPVWPQGRQTDMNSCVEFRAVFEVPSQQRATLRLTACNVYRAFVNGAFCGYGPARGPHGWYRLDEYDITSMLKPGKNVVAVEVAAYNVNNFYLMDLPGFLQAEIVSDGNVVAATGGENAFQARLWAERLQKVERYSFQRPFTEVYRLAALHDAWKTDPGAPFEPAPLEVTEPKQLLPRRVSYPSYLVKPTLSTSASGTTTPRGEFEPHKGSTIVKIGPKFEGFTEPELEVIPSIDVQRYEFSAPTPVNQPFAPLSIQAGQWNNVDFGTNFSGFLGATITCTAPTTLYVTFDEVLSKTGEVDHRRLGCVNVLTWQFQPGTYQVESFEPYTLRYARVFVSEGACTVSDLYIRQYNNPDTALATFSASDKRLEKLYAAGVETFAQNAVDVFMDCPSRERAGWLCDSFFTARTAKDLGGTTVVEKNFLENFQLPDQFQHLPEGMLPMCYPADHYDGVFIPNWAMWLVVELEEYAARSGDAELVQALRPKVLALFDYFKKFENSDGLLEKLESWVFVEWSEANKFVQDVNYPSNMLYAGALAAAGRTYNIPDLVKKADAIRQTIRSQSYDGEFFVDNALRKDGKLEVTRNRSEVCQYFAFYFDTASAETHPELWKKLRDEFGPKRKEKGLYPDVHVANSFIGNMLRMEILSRYGRSQQILDESIEYLLYMADRTGTLWENAGDYASCNHGFASHIVHTLYRDILGLYSIDTLDKNVIVKFADVRMPSCSGTVPTPDGPITMNWTQDADTIRYTLTAPEGYKTEIENPTGKKLVRQ